MSMEDPAEIAALATEFISGLDNLPQEVSHIVKEIEHKDAKVQDILPKIASREAQLRELLMKGGGGSSGILSEADRVKAEKLVDKIRSDYARADEWSAQKEILSMRMWRAVHAHHSRLNDEMSRISPHVLASIVGPSALAAPQIPALTNLPVALAGLRSPAGEFDIHTPGGLKRKAGALSPALAGALPATPLSGRGAGGGSGRWGGRTTPVDSGTPAPSDKLGQSGRSGSGTGRKSRGGGMAGSAGRGLHGSSALSTDGAGAGSLGGIESEAHEGEEGEEKDETLYCFCQRVSFGEMIGCDSDDPECKEWFHIGCVGVSKPLPQKWYCAECAQKLKNKRRR
ncbi:hypothetical protein IE53DRAFT_384214 [Violaceomyces palustris]|uniref:Uncharacterized protein n=1 Tax=Violaceomyces palustris TaxID=1673888 RepID=A0ACD0P5R5_9BASI|nr:hypothetical protein IE53DRAFT_384214 [Violaceomyces palustris]